jgi:hypothetical protein
MCPYTCLSMPPTYQVAHSLLVPFFFYYIALRMDRRLMQPTKALWSLQSRKSVEAMIVMILQKLQISQLTLGKANSFRSRTPAVSVTWIPRVASELSTISKFCKTKWRKSCKASQIRTNDAVPFYSAHAIPLDNCVPESPDSSLDLPAAMLKFGIL